MKGGKSYSRSKPCTVPYPCRFFLQNLLSNPFPTPSFQPVGKEQPEMRRKQRQDQGATCCATCWVCLCKPCTSAVSWRVSSVFRGDSSRTGVRARGPDDTDRCTLPTVLACLWLVSRRSTWRDIRESCTLIGWWCHTHPVKDRMGTKSRTDNQRRYEARASGHDQNSCPTKSRHAAQCAGLGKHLAIQLHPSVCIQVCIRCVQKGVKLGDDDIQLHLVQTTTAQYHTLQIGLDLRARSRTFLSGKLG